MEKDIYYLPGYSYAFKKGELVGKARLEGINASYKDLAAVCYNIRGKKVEEAIELLEKVAKLEVPIYYPRWNKRMGHRRELGGKKGRYPQKAAKIILKVLKSAIANAKDQGYLPPFVVVHAAANKKHRFTKIAAKGIAWPIKYETARVEIVVKSLNPEIKPKLKEEKKEKEEKKKEKEEKPEKETKEKKSAGEEKKKSSKKGKKKEKAEG